MGMQHRTVDKLNIAVNWLVNSHFELVNAPDEVETRLLMKPKRLLIADKE
jgi:hypothetical protein